MKTNNDVKHLKREILIRLIDAFYKDNFAENVRIIPYEIRPKNSEIQYRCCIYKERAILKDRIVASLGFSIEEKDDTTSLSTYANAALQRDVPDQKYLTILETACKGCPPCRVYVTDLCQGCVARPCVNTCKFQAIQVNNGRAVIDNSKCKNCGMCINACPYQAITKVIVPCENSCPVGAITRDASSYTSIDFSKCIFCGKCINACPFGAIHEKSQIIDVLKHIKSGANVIAMVAPSIFGQIPCQPEQLHAAIKMVGFAKVYEVAQGADITAKIEAKDFNERLAAGQPFMTTSCCAGYNELVKKHILAMQPYCSDAKTPLFYTAEIAKKEYPSSITVFISPCVAKRGEALANSNVDYVITCEELGALFVARKIDITSCAPEKFSHTPSKHGRNFAVSSGVVTSVQAVCKNNCPHLKPVVISGVNKQIVKDLKKYAATGSCDQGNLIEVMMCDGGCVGGNATINTTKMLAALSWAQIISLW